MSENFESRLIEAMAEMANPSKSSTATVPTKSGRQYTYRYETLEQVLGAVRPPLLAHGIGLTQRQEWDEVTASYVLRTVVFDDDHTMVLDQRPIQSFDDAQACGSWETYMRRYALRTAFGLTGEDDDGAATVGAKRAKPQQPKTHKQAFARIAELKMRAMENGVKEEGINSWYAAKFGKVGMNRLTNEQLKEVVDYLETIVRDSADRHLLKGNTDEH
ncbi:MAG: ERF family protein [Coriobacteriaceae bacterium]|uniref:ERF family protein n=1 Tax=Tractidigestivibacter sp. TaxID=2847320 RepID=UPI002A827B54|nr:ERF family protein [Tractidigestivibacter sp.]MCI6274404.1 ERF family protein [Coriobacteriaceae bacterium]MCI6844459.1 ERF family protein [Coriobacteriaceae bacterium]MDY4535462.1 ERF family protein [Tractidigestivibacter sp.]MDY5272153.1 ERF family protein [Tractidigestivibacter sp.]